MYGRPPRAQWHSSRRHLRRGLVLVRLHRLDATTAGRPAPLLRAARARFDWRGGMKGPAAAATVAPAPKRRWRCVAAACAALALLFFSVIVPLAVLLGLHSRFPCMYLVDESAVSVYDGSEGGSWEPIPSEENDTTQVNDTMVKLLPPTSKVWTDTNASQPNHDKLNANISIHPALSIQQDTTFEISSMLNNIRKS